MFPQDASAGQDSLAVSEAPGSTDCPSQQQMPSAAYKTASTVTSPQLCWPQQRQPFLTSAKAVRVRAHRSCNGAL